MKIKYKIILSLVIVIIAASLPITVFILDSQERDKIGLILHHGDIQSRILAYSAMNILLMNGGDIQAAKVDGKSMMQILSPLVNDGMVYADAVTISSNRLYNGIILASFMDNSLFGPGDFHMKRMTDEDVTGLLKRQGAREISIKGMTYYEFINSASLNEGKPVSIGRVVFSKIKILEPVIKLRKISYMATGLAIFGAVIMGLVFSRFISKPIDDLTLAVSQIEIGDANTVIPVRSRDETGKLANTFNHLVAMINLEISELLKANRDLKRLDNLKDEFLANISHELRTPLTGIIGLAESLMSGITGDMGGESSQTLDLIARSGRRLSYLVDDILDFTKIRNRDMEIAMLPVNLGSVISVVLAVLGPLIDRKKLRVAVHVDPPDLNVLGDENRLQQVMLNVIGNAVKFTGKGVITIEAGMGGEEPGKAVIHIRDSGIGIAETDIERIFESFEQADGSISRAYGGAGLGLAITRKLVELHGGSIRAESVKGSGSTFIITLKQAEGKGDAGGLRSGAGAPVRGVELFTDDIKTIDTINGKHGEWKNMNIMVVDDDPVTLRVVNSFLLMEGYSVETALSGTEALDLLDRGSHPDLILLDVMLPGITGYDVCRKIREKYSQYELPVIMLTARNKSHDIIAGIRAGANDYLSKPINRDELLARIANLVCLKDSIRHFNELSIIKRDMVIAHGIHHSAILQEIPHIDNVRFALRYKPMQNLGGDFYDIIKIGPDRFGILVADVSGHGISAAIICAMLKMAFSFHAGKGEDPAAMLKAVNSSIYQYLNGMFITASYVYIDMASGKINRAGAGHWPILIFNEKGDEYILDTGNGMPFGLVEDPGYESRESVLHRGDRIFLYTDGIIEVRDGNDRMMGLENFRVLLKKNIHLNSEEIADRIIDSVMEWKGGGPGAGLDDDVTLMVVDILDVEMHDKAGVS